MKWLVQGFGVSAFAGPTADRQGSVRLRQATADLRCAASGFVIGAAVTALESVCTGQVYVPTLVMVAREGGELSGTALRYLLLYNAMFLVPLVTVFVLTYCGLRTATLLEWSKRNVVVSKLLLGVFFLAMAAAIAVL